MKIPLGKWARSALRTITVGILFPERASDPPVPPVVEPKAETKRDA